MLTDNVQGRAHEGFKRIYRMNQEKARDFLLTREMLSKEEQELRGLVLDEGLQPLVGFFLYWKLPRH